MGNTNLKALDTHFEFGENWLDYLNRVDEAAIASAEQGLLRLIPSRLLKGARFLDIGCGSGLHSLAALRLGVAELVALDIDPTSVKAAEALIAAHARLADAQVKELSIFEADSETLGTFDIVYSWGVLHHTGAMWEAVERASRFVRPNGLLVIALYERRPSCAFWLREKRLYSRSPEFVRKVLRGAYKSVFWLGLIATGRNPAEHFRKYRSRRGMNFHHDVHDWMGGYPYESASMDQVKGRMRDLGFEIVFSRGIKKGLRLLGTGCAEYTLVRTGAPIQSR